MKKLLTILFISTMFAGNLEVDGGITATGEVQSPTIQALLNQIAQLQEQIALLQLSIESSINLNNSRIYELDYDDLPNSSGSNNGVRYLSLSDLLGFQDRFLVYPYVYIGQDCNIEVTFVCEGHGSEVKLFEGGVAGAQALISCSEQNSYSSHGEGPILEIQKRTSDGEDDQECWDGNIKLLITANFPN